jgi:hypothetical protein
MSSIAEKKAAKRRAKKEAASAQATVSAVNALKDTMANDGVTNVAAESTSISSVESSRASASSAAGSSSTSIVSAVSSDRRMQLKEKGNNAFTSKNMQEVRISHITHRKQAQHHFASFIVAL